LYWLRVEIIPFCTYIYSNSNFVENEANKHSLENDGSDEDKLHFSRLGKVYFPFPSFSLHEGFNHLRESIYKHTEFYTPGGVIRTVNKKAGLASRNIVSNIPRCVSFAVVFDFSSSLLFKFG